MHISVRRASIEERFKAPSEIGTIVQFTTQPLWISSGTYTCVLLNVPSDGERETTATTSPSPRAKKTKQRHRTMKSRLDFISMKMCRYKRE
jgi:hypothetical protein